MNCNEAQAMLAAYRELKDERIDTTELDAHLEQCSTCRQALARYNFVGDQLRSLPAIEPSAVMRDRLMRALAAEHIHFIQHATSATPPPPTPVFLKPYLQQSGQHAQPNEQLAAFSTAETGPLPIIQIATRRRKNILKSQFGVIGLVASLLMVLMMGGLTSLLLLTHGDPTTGVVSIVQPANVRRVTYTTLTPYQNVVSAVGDRSYIYYTAYQYGSQRKWMLEQLDRSTKVSTPLLATASNSPLIVLDSNKNWLIWLQYNEPLPIHRNLVQDENYAPQRTWSLHYLSLAQLHQNGGTNLTDQTTLLSGTFDQEAVPSWIHTPIQGLWFMQDTLLIAMVDVNGTSHLLEDQLGLTGNAAMQEIASANPNHIFTSPTANSYGTKIYWSDEWRTDDTTLHSNIWQLRVDTLPDQTHGFVKDQTQETMSLFRQDGTSFQPVMVDETLFFLSTADANSSAQSAKVTATPTPAGQLNYFATPRIDPRIYAQSPDETIRGTLLSIPQDSSTNAPPVVINTAGLASSLQAGAGYLLWQTELGGYGMLDMRTGNSATNVTVGTALEGARFVSVNGETAVWINNSDNSADPSNTSVSFMAFNWPN